MEAFNTCTQGRGDQGDDDGSQHERGFEEDVFGLYQGTDERERDKSWRHSMLEKRI